MAKQVYGNPVKCRNITLSTIPITETGASGVVTAAGENFKSVLNRGDSIFLGLDGGDAGGYVDGQEYYVFDVGTTTLKVADTREDAFAGTWAANASGDAGAGDAYVNSTVGGILFVGSGQTVNIKGIDMSSDWCSHEGISDGTILPFMVGKISPLGTTATSLVAWDE